VVEQGGEPLRAGITLGRKREDEREKKFSEGSAKWGLLRKRERKT